MGDRARNKVFVSNVVEGWPEALKRRCHWQLVVGLVALRM